MINNIKEVELGDVLLSLKTGLNPRQNFQLNTNDAKNWYVTVRELNGTGIDFLPQTDKVNDKALKLINNRSNLEVYDVLFSGTGTIGKTSIIQEDPYNWNIKEGVYTLKPNRDLIDPYYLLCQLSYYSRLGVFSRQTGGSTVFSIPMQVLLKTKILLPNLENQKNISNVIKTIDDKISLNTKINKEQEALARLIYDYWFSQYEFPDINGKPYKSSGGTMVKYNGSNDVLPVGWIKDNITSVADLHGGGTPNKSIQKYWNGNIPFFTPTDATSEMFSLSTRENITDQGLVGSSTKLFDIGTIIITARGSVGKTVVTGVPMAMNQSCYALVPKTSVDFGYLYFAVSDLVHLLKVKSSGSVFNSIVTNDILLTSVAVPPLNLIKEFGLISKPLFDNIRHNLIENVQLTEIKDWLLPMLMNGQVGITKK